MTVESIQREVATQYGVTVANLVGPGNHHAYAHPRAVAMYLIRRLSKPTLSFPKIGRRFGGRHHTTVMAAIDKIALAATSDGSSLTASGAQLRSDLAAIETRLSAPAIVETFHHVRFALGSVEGRPTHRDLIIGDSRGMLPLIELSRDDRMALAALLLRGL